LRDDQLRVWVQFADGDRRGGVVLQAVTGFRFWILDFRFWISSFGEDVRGFYLLLGCGHGLTKE
jgi:hypothetical protein